MINLKFVFIQKFGNFFIDLLAAKQIMPCCYIRNDSKCSFISLGILRDFSFRMTIIVGT